ncbi:MAG TPA: carboxypeptidase regulatory-like domain-containing protein [Pyrinomonadaceae bacterium]|nr:carboxypeptidase regulatory-like domain-containing protein [Pyrinomonadaceae bacterium]
MKIKKLSFNVLERVCPRTFLLSVFLSLSFAIAYAAPGDLDSSFGMNGTVLTEFDRGTTAQVVLVQPDSKIIIAGTVAFSNSPNNTSFAVIRFNSDGSLDSTFGTNGKVFTSILSRNGAGAGALQPDGKILIGGSAENKFGLARYNQDGSLDLGFGEGGKVYTEFSASPLAAKIHSILIQPDGKIVAVGGNGNSSIYLAKYKSDGVLDSAFGDGGKVTTRYVSEGNIGESALLQLDGKILIGGYINTNDSATNSALFRYNTNGTLDSSFDGDGVAVYPMSGSHDSIKKILFRPDGKVITVGTANNIGQSVLNYALGVYNQDGTPDLSFGNNGVSILPAIGITTIEDALLQSDGKIVIAGSKSNFNGSSQSSHSARFNSNGTFDFTFGNGGKVNLPIGFRSRGYAIAIQSDNKLLIAGSGYNLSLKAGFALSRLQGGDGQIPTLANITGRVINEAGRGIGGVQVILSGGSPNLPRYVRTNPFGFYRFADLPVNSEYDLTVRSKKRASFQSSVHLLLNGNEYAEDLVFNYSTKPGTLE